MVGSNPGKFANKGLSLLEPAGSSTSLLLAALFFTSQEGSSGQNMCSTVAGKLFAGKTHFCSVLVDRCTPGDEKPPGLTSVAIQECFFSFQPLS